MYGEVGQRWVVYMVSGYYNVWLCFDLLSGKNMRVCRRRMSGEGGQGWTRLFEVGRLGWRAGCLFWKGS